MDNNDNINEVQILIILNIYNNNGNINDRNINNE